MKRSFLSACLILGAIGTWAQERPAPPQCLALKVSPRDAALTSGQRFSARLVSDLLFTLELPASLEGEHELELRIFGPSGSLYQSLAVPIAKPNSPAQFRSLKGYPYPKKQVTPRLTGTGKASRYTVSVPFPVGGTAIVHSGLYGRYRVEAFLDGGKTPCGPSATFQLIP